MVQSLDQIGKRAERQLSDVAELLESKGTGRWPGKEGYSIDMEWQEHAVNATGPPCELVPKLPQDRYPARHKGLDAMPAEPVPLEPVDREPRAQGIHMEASQLHFISRLAMQTQRRRHVGETRDVRHSVDRVEIRQQAIATLVIEIERGERVGWIVQRKGIPDLCARGVDGLGLEIRLSRAKVLRGPRLHTVQEAIADDKEVVLAPVRYSRSVLGIGQEQGNATHINGAVRAVVGDVRQL